ncbi:MAG: hypothetical protein RL272_293 [Candidatus Parcubacteria bacterium]
MNGGAAIRRVPSSLLPVRIPPSPIKNRLADASRVFYDGVLGLNTLPAQDILGSPKTVLIKTFSISFIHDQDVV